MSRTSRRWSVRSQAHAVAQEVVNLQPQLLKAQGDADAAKIKATEAAQLAHSLAQAVQENADRSKDAAAEADKARQEAKKLIDEPTSGLTAQAKDFDNLAAKTALLAAHAAERATAAASAYASAVSAVKNAQTAIVSSQEKDNLKLDDPRLILAKDHRVEALLLIDQASAQYRAGMAYLIGSVTAQTQDTVSKAVENAYTLGGAGGAKPPAAGGAEVEKSKTQAIEMFTKALATLERTNAIIGPNILDTSPIRWLTASLQAVTYHAKYLVTADAADQTQAEEFAKKARNANPNLHLMVSDASTSAP